MEVRLRPFQDFEILNLTFAWFFIKKKILDDYV